MASQPASGVEAFEVVIPPGTPQTSPVEVLTTVHPSELVGVQIRIPAGHNFLTGLRIAIAHAQVLPRTEGGWIIGDNESLSYDTLGYLNTGALSCFGFNTDIYPHTFHVRYELVDFAYLRGAAAEQLDPLPQIV